MQQLNDMGYRSIYLTDDHFLLKRERINAICNGIIERKLEFRWGCEGRVDATAIDQLPIMRQAGEGTANNAAGTCRIRMGGGDADAVETVVCDNGFDQAIGGGSIVVHTK